MDGPIRYFSLTMKCNQYLKTLRQQAVSDLDRSPTFRKHSPPPCLHYDDIIIPLMTEAERVSQMLGSCPDQTQPVAQEDFIEFKCCESFKLNTKKHNKEKLKMS
jgi:hypothetical protein